jgi:PPK2 family polyphosphate:nucleotide phosphotransferase
MGRTHVVKGKVDLAKIDTDKDGGLKKDEGEAKIEKLLPQLYDLQEMMFAAGQHALLIVLQGLDTSGKEGTIGCLSKGINAHGVKVAPFKQPTEQELAHDFLWRIHSQAPAKGMIAIFNRSHYEDVLVVRVHDLVPEEQWKERYAQINNFEKLLTDSETIVLKFFLHISKEEQKQRLLDREKDPEKAWKLNVGDWKERKLWDKYIEAYEDALGKTSTDHAPWHIVPADHKWYRNLVVLETVVDALKPYRDDWMTQLKEVGKCAKAEIDDFREGHDKADSANGK